MSTGVKVIQKEAIGIEAVELAGLDNAKNHGPQFTSPDGVMTIVIVAAHDC